MKKMRHSLYLIVAAIVLLAVSCNDAKLPDPADETAPFEVVFETPTIPIVDEVSTKVTVSPNGTTSYNYLWEAADTVGIFPNTGSQVFFSMSVGAGTASASFNGGAWLLRESSQYYSYYPFVGDMYLEADRIPVDFTGQRQTGVSTYDGANFYMATSGTTANDGSLRFSYGMLNTVLRMDATLPVGTYTKMMLSLDEPLFAKEGYYDLTSNNPSIVVERRSKTQEIALQNFTVSSASTPVSVYISQAPLDLRGKTMTVSIEASDGRSYSYAAHPSKVYDAGTCYRFNCSMTQAVPDPQVFSQPDLWPSLATIPDYSDSQFAAYAEDANSNGFDPAAHRMPYIQYFARPSNPNGTCALIITGEDYSGCPESAPMREWVQKLSARGIQCVGLVYRTPRGGVSFSYSAWQDAQRAIRVIRAGAILAPDVYVNANKIGVVGIGAGAHLGLLLAAQSAYRAYPVDNAYGDGAISGSLNWVILQSTRYATADCSATGTLPSCDAYWTGVTVDPNLQLSTMPPTCFIHGQDDPYSAMASTLLYRQLRANGVASEVHLYPGNPSGGFGIDRSLEFLTQKSFLGTLQAEVQIMDRYASDAARGNYVRENIWPSGRTPNYDGNQSIPYIEWHFPRVKKTDAIQIIYSCGSYMGSDPMSFDVTSARRYLNEKGMTVVTLNYRTPRPVGLSKHTSAWQDLQRTIRLVRSKAASYGLDPNRIGIMGASAGGHLTLMGTTSSRHQAYAPIDAIDEISCKVQWGIANCPAYALTDGMGDTGNEHGGNTDADILVPEFDFDADTAPMMFMHGNGDGIAAMNSVKAWEKLRSMGIPAECHTFIDRPHTFQQSGSPGTGSYNWLERVGEYVEQWW